MLADMGKLPARRFHGRLEALHLIHQQVLRQHVLRHFRTFTVQHIGLADGNAAADAGAVQGQHVSLISRRMSEASRASFLESKPAQK